MPTPNKVLIRTQNINKEVQTLKSTRIWKLELEDLAGRRGWWQTEAAPRVESRRFITTRVRVIG